MILDLDTSTMLFQDCCSCKLNYLFIYLFIYLSRALFIAVVVLFVCLFVLCVIYYLLVGWLVCISLDIYSWLEPLFFLGARHELDQEDMYVHPKETDSEELLMTFNRLELNTGMVYLLHC